MNKVNIKGRDYKIFVKKFSDNEKNIVGQIDKKRKEIFICKDEISKEETLNTLIHELIHGYFYECGLVNYCDDEDLVNWFEVQFLAILKTFLKSVSIVFLEDKVKVDLILKSLKLLLKGECK